MNRFRRWLHRLPPADIALSAACFAVGGVWILVILAREVFHIGW